MKNKNRIILGIDPGYDRVGWSISTGDKSKFSCIALGCIQTDKDNNIFTRYQKIQSDLKEIINHFQPTELAIETLFFSVNKKTAIRVSEARGIIIGVCLEMGLHVYEYDPVTIKLAVTGDGKANKQAVEKMVKMQVNGSVNKHIDDAIDAVAIAMTHVFTLQV